MSLPNRCALYDEPTQDTRFHDASPLEPGATGIVIDSKVVRFLGIEEQWHKLLVHGRVGWVYEGWMRPA